MLLPTAVFLARQLPGPLNDVANTGKDVGSTVAGAGETAVDAGKDVADQAQDGIDQANKYKDYIAMYETLTKFVEEHAMEALIIFVIVILVISFLFIYCCVHCVLDCRNCCCKSHERALEEHEREAHVPPPAPTPWCCGTLHWDRTYIARGCGQIPVQDGETWGFWGREGNWFYQLRRGVIRWPDWCPAAIKTEAGRREQRARFKSRAQVVAEGARRAGKQAYSLAELEAKKGIKWSKEEYSRGRDGVEKYRQDMGRNRRQGPKTEEAE